MLVESCNVVVRCDMGIGNSLGCFFVDVIVDY